MKKTYKFPLRYNLLMIAFCLLSIGWAQNRATVISKLGHADNIMRRYTDSLESLKLRFENYNYIGEDTLSNPYYFFLFSSPTFFPLAVEKSFALSSLRPLTKEEALVNYSAMVLTELYGQSPSLTHYNETATDGKGLRQNVLQTPITPTIQLTEKISSGTTNILNDNDLEWDVHATKPNFWTFPLNFSMQFMQSHVSDNWYKGGESNYAALATVVAEARYDNQQKILFSNKLEMKLGFQSSQSDQIHKYKTNTDLLRLTNKLGIQASKHWYYTLMLQSWTQFYKGYRANNSKVFSDFMSPFESLLSLGMDYKLNNKRLQLTATISPFALDFIYVARSPIATSHGVKEGRHFNWGVGSNITVNSKWKIASNISWNSRAYIYTDYSRTQIEWENTFQLKLNKYLSTKIFLYPRFDDNHKRKQGQSYFQFYENLSFGLDISL